MLAYCDKIAHEIKKALDGVVTEGDELLADVSKIHWDLHPEEGYFLSTKKTIEVQDAFQKKYRVTVEEI